MLVDITELASALNADNLLDEARRISGLSDFGDERFIFALRRMTECYIQDVQIDQGGLGLVRSSIVRQLVNRARLEDRQPRHAPVWHHQDPSHARRRSESAQDLHVAAGQSRPVPRLGRKGA